MCWSARVIGLKVRSMVNSYTCNGYTMGNARGFETIVDHREYRLVFDDVQHLVWIYEVK